MSFRHMDECSMTKINTFMISELLYALKRVVFLIIAKGCTSTSTKDRNVKLVSKESPC